MESDARVSWRPALAAALLAPALHLARFGYSVGFSDQDEFLPWLLHRLDPSLLSSDWLVGVQESGFNVRSGILAVLEPFAAWLGVEPALAVLYGVVWLILGLAVYDFMHGVSGSPAAALAGTVATLAAIPRWTLGGSAMTATMLVPSMAAWSLGAAALALHFRGRSLLPGILLGAAAWLQPVDAVMAALPLAIAGIARGGPKGSLASGLVRDSLRLAVPAGLLVLPLAVLYLLGRPAPPSPGFEPGFLEILTRFRAPHHFLPAAFPAGDWIQVLVLTASGAAGFALWRRTAERGSARYVLALLVTAASLVALGFVSLAIPAVALLQPFRITVLSGLALAALVSAGAAALVRDRSPGSMGRLDRAVLHPAVPAVAALALALPLVLGSPRTAADADLAAAADWLRTRSESRSTVAVPPSTTGFRYRSGRAVVVTFKAIPFGPADLAAWYRRLSDLAPGAVTPSGREVAGVLSELDAAYERLSERDLDEIALRYGVSWAVRRTPIDPEPLHWALESRHGPVLVYGRRSGDAR
jgi:hypothetical protein